MRMFSVCLGAGKYSFSANRAGEVLVRCRFGGKSGLWATELLKHGLIEKAAPEFKLVTVWAREAALLLATNVAIGRVDAYICMGLMIDEKISLMF